ncbi:MAG TPA: zinc-dependent alcohol dehydrogenase family protein [Burkholderiales bacterium]|nr:zinc-dependent alcohol dehydrogenase family protein [Burkholderiales bacterium]
MRAMQLAGPGKPLQLVVREIGEPDPGQLLLRVLACGVCRTDLHIVDGDLPRLDRAVIPGHEIVGEVIERGAQVERFSVGQRVGVPWLGWTCGDCRYCRAGRENLCDRARFTGYHIDGGYAEFALAAARYCFALPESYAPAEAAPLLCAGLIGYRALSIAGDAQQLGIYGFGAAAHIVAQVARFQGRRLFAPVGALVPAALRAVSKGGTVVCAGIHMSEIPAFPYEILWGERRVVSVANLTRRDGEEFLALAPKVPVRTSVEIFPLERANQALAHVREGRINGAAVLAMPERAARSS